MLFLFFVTASFLVDYILFWCSIVYCILCVMKNHRDKTCPSRRVTFTTEGVSWAPFFGDFPLCVVSSKLLSWISCYFHLVIANQGCCLWVPTAKDHCCSEDFDIWGTPLCDTDVLAVTINEDEHWAISLFLSSHPQTILWEHSFRKIFSFTP